MRVLLAISLLLGPFGCERDRPLQLAADDLGTTGADLASSPAPDLGGRCGAFTGTPCPLGWFCEFPARQCPVPDELRDGTCVERPEACPGVEQPVCGCDGRTYGNDCARQAAGVSLAYDGVCGCTEACPVGQWCVECKGSLGCRDWGSLCK